MKVKLDSIRRFLREDNQLEANFSEDLLEIVDMVQDIDNPKMLIDEYPKMHSVLGYWLSDYKMKVGMLIAERERLYGVLDTKYRQLLRMEGKTTESNVMSRINGDDEYFQVRTALINKEKVAEFLEHMMNALDKDILVQMSVNSRANTGVNGVD